MLDEVPGLGLGERVEPVASSGSELRFDVVESLTYLAQQSGWWVEGGTVLFSGEPHQAAIVSNVAGRFLVGAPWPFCLPDPLLGP